MARYTFSEITRDGNVTGYAVERVEGEIGAFKKFIIRTYTVGPGGSTGMDRRSPDLHTAYRCAKGSAEALNG
jgi:hypothetical protein